MHIKRQKQEEIIALTFWIGSPLLTLKPGQKFPLKTFPKEMNVAGISDLGKGSFCQSKCVSSHLIIGVVQRRHKGVEEIVQNSL